MKSYHLIEKNINGKLYPCYGTLFFRSTMEPFPNDRAKRLADENYETPG
jgi:hypothetical protein